MKSEQDYRVRECVHRAKGAPGDFYPGNTYVKQLQRMRTTEALRAASKVTSFFWADAPQIVVWLCGECACELGLREEEVKR